MELEWDEDKRQWTKRERHLDFADVERFEFVSTEPDLTRDYGERRFKSVGYLDGVICTFCWTPRHGRIRVISLRRANERERKKYQAQGFGDA